jgi:hypothetical protein
VTAKGNPRLLAGDGENGHVVDAGVVKPWDQMRRAGSRRRDAKHQVRP